MPRWLRSQKELRDREFLEVQHVFFGHAADCGLSQRMKISGHKTDSMERRYNMVDLDDLKESRAKMDTWFRSQVSEEQSEAKATK